MRQILKTVAYLLDPHNLIAHDTLLTQQELHRHSLASANANANADGSNSNDVNNTRLAHSDSTNSLASLDSSTSSNAAVPYDNRFYAVGSSLAAVDDLQSA